jgi:3-deoxy-D-arabino-heptulosonate 7-phosphate (DAHP) synthase
VGFSPAGARYTSVQTVTISSTNHSATIYYTTNGTAPTKQSSVYSRPITVDSTETIKAIAVISGVSAGGVASSTYTIDLPEVAAPSFSPAAGTYNSVQNITITTSTPSTTIFYTTNGTRPTTSSPIYSGPITVSSTSTIKAIAVDLNATNVTALGTSVTKSSTSRVASADYNVKVLTAKR